MPANGQEFTENLTKLAVAERQLVCSIRLFFTNYDPIAVHTLAGSAAEMLETICDKAHISPFRDHALATNASLSNKEFWGLRNRYRNFFKHADRPPEVIEGFSDEQNDSILFVASHDLGLLRQGQMTPEAQVMNLWFCAVYREKLASPDLINQIDSLYPAIHIQPRYRQKRMSFESLDWVHSQPALLGELPWLGEARAKFK
jgi:hypothetical protein